MQRMTILAAFAAVCLALLSEIATAGPAQDRLEKLRVEADERSAANDVAKGEIEMIEYRRTLMGRPGLILYVVFFNDVGQPVDYFVTAGKCTSSTKRLTKSWRFKQGQVGVNDKGEARYGDFVLPRPDLDGVHGSSDHYIFCRTVDGKYKQWSGKYYASDVPIEITIKPLAVEFKKDGTNGIQKQH